jgi:hypothetical protein
MCQRPVGVARDRRVPERAGVDRVGGDVVLGQRRHHSKSKQGANGYQVTQHFNGQANG